MSNSGLSIKHEALREVAFGSITALYTSLGAPLSHDAFRVTFVNNTDKNLYLTTDTSQNEMKFAPGMGKITDDKTNDMYRKSGTQFSIKGETGNLPTKESAWLEVEYV